jgi:hypothetical protein
LTVPALGHIITTGTYLAVAQNKVLYILFHYGTWAGIKDFLMRIV